MAELLVRVVDKVSVDPVLDARLTKRGHVIVVRPDGWTWGTEELANPDWRLMRVAGADPVDFAGLIVEEPETDPTTPNKFRQRRAFRLDLDASTVDDAGLRSFFDDFTLTPIDVKAETTKTAAAVTETVVSTIEEVVIVDLPDGTKAATSKTTTVSREVVRYPVGLLDDATAAKLGGLAVTFVPADLRTSVVADVDAAVIEKVTVPLPPIDDPSVIGPSPVIF